MTKTIELTTQQEAQTQAISWLLEMERVTDPNFINAMILNIFRISKRVSDVEVVMDSRNKRMLIWLELDRWGQWFGEKKVQSLVENMMTDVLPSYEFRVTYDRDLLERAVKILSGEYQDGRREEESVERPEYEGN